MRVANLQVFARRSTYLGGDDNRLDRAGRRLNSSSEIHLSQSHTLLEQVGTALATALGIARDLVR